jgi:hypothetical protein
MACYPTRNLGVNGHPNAMGHPAGPHARGGQDGCRFRRRPLFPEDVPHCLAIPHEEADLRHGQTRCPGLAAASHGQRSDRRRRGTIHAGKTYPGRDAAPPLRGRHAGKDGRHHAGRDGRHHGGRDGKAAARTPGRRSWKNHPMGGAAVPVRHRRNHGHPCGRTPARDHGPCSPRPGHGGRWGRSFRQSPGAVHRRSGARVAAGFGIRPRPPAGIRQRIRAWRRFRGNHAHPAAGASPCRG